MKLKPYSTYCCLQLFAAVLFCMLCLFPRSAGAERIVRVGYFPLHGFYDIAGENSLNGYGYEYTNAVARQANWKALYVPYASWVAALEALDHNEIDILAPAQRTPEREGRYLFDAFPIGTEYGSLLTLANKDNLIFEDYDTFNSLRIGCVPSIIFLNAYHSYAQAHNFKAPLSYYRDTPALLEALEKGEVDAIIANLMVQTPDLKPLAYFGASPIYYMVNPKSPQVLEELNQAINQLLSRQPLFQSQLEEKYFSHMSKAPLSKEEIDFVSKLDNVNVGLRGNNKPYSYLNDQGQPEGVDVAILNFISSYTGLHFTYHIIPAGVDPIAYAKEHSFTLLADVEAGDNLTASKLLTLSSSYLTSSKSFIGLDKAVFNPSQPTAIALAKTTPQLLQEWQQKYPKFTFLEYSNLEECIKAVRKGEASLLLNNHFTIEDLLAKPRNSDLHIVPATALDVKMCYGLLNDGDAPTNQQLLSIINKALTHISPNDVESYMGVYMQKTHAHFSFLDFLYMYRYLLLTITLLLLTGGYFYTKARRAKERAMRAIAENEQKLQKITNNINGGVVVLENNKGFSILYANDGFLELIGYTRQEFEAGPAESYLAYVQEEDLPTISKAIATDQETLSLELHIRHKNGSFVPCIFNCTVGSNAEGKRELYCVIIDMTEQKRLLEQLRIDQKRTELILSRIDEIFYEVNYKTGRVTCSPSFKDRLGWELPPTFNPSHRHNIADTWRVLKEDLEQLSTTAHQMLEAKVMNSCTVRLQTRSGHYEWCEVNFYPILSTDQQVASIIGLIRNVNDVVTERESLIMQTHIDPLTGLYNKEAFAKMVAQDLQSYPHLNHALIFVDLDHFKALNDTLGHVMGDKAICEAADKLQLIFSHLDIISRFGGDEFCIFVKDIPVTTLRGKLAWLLEKLQAEYTNDTAQVKITCSAGIATTDCLSISYKELLEKADKALYASKEAGRNRYTLYRELEHQQKG